MKNTAIGAVITALIGTPALAADMAVKAPPPPVAAAFSWTGLYIGGEGGGASGSSVQFFTTAPGGTINRYDIFGAEGGVTGGFNWQFSPQLVAGIEGDFSWGPITGGGGTTASYNCGSICSTTVNDFGTLRGRVGYAFGSNVLVYGTGGWAQARITPDLDGFTQANTRSGWTAGGGVEYAFNRNWSAKVEYLFLDFSNFVWTNATNALLACTGLNCSTDAKLNIIRVGVNYRFGPP